MADAEMHRTIMLLPLPHRVCPSGTNRLNHRYLAAHEPRVLASAHLISLFARASTSGGIVRPICFAVFRLITSSNFVGCSHRQIGGLGSLQDSVHVVGDAPVAVREVRPVGHEPTGIYSFSPAVHRR